MRSAPGLRFAGGGLKLARRNQRDCYDLVTVCLSNALLALRQLHLVTSVRGPNLGQSAIAAVAIEHQLGVHRPIGYFYGVSGEKHLAAAISVGPRLNFAVQVVDGVLAAGEALVTDGEVEGNVGF